MPVLPRRALSLALVSVTALALSACAKATFEAAPWGSPLEAVTAAAQKFEPGMNYKASLEGSRRTQTLFGSDIPAKDMLRIHKSEDAGAQDTRVIGNELWLKYEASNLPTGWGHFADAEIFASTGVMAGPSTWVPALVEQISSIERVGDRRFGGVLDFEAVDEDDTGFTKYEINDLDDGDEVAFTLALNADGTMSSFAFELEGTSAGDVKVTYTFSDYGAAMDVVVPSDPVTELTATNFMEWLLGKTD